MQDYIQDQLIQAFISHLHLHGNVAIAVTILL